MKCDHYGNPIPCEFAGAAADGAWVCARCSKNTTGGAWPDPAGLPVARVVTLETRNAKLETGTMDPAAAAAIARQLKTCGSCGDPGIEA